MAAHDALPTPRRRLPRQLSQNEARVHMAVLAAVFFAIGITLWLQPARYANTPSYANLLDIARQHTWSVVYLVAAALKVTAIAMPSRRAVATVSHAVAFALVATWLAAFVIRWITDPGTTVVNVCSWSAYLYLVLRSAWKLDAPPAAPLPPSPDHGPGG